MGYTKVRTIHHRPPLPGFFHPAPYLAVNRTPFLWATLVGIPSLLGAEPAPDFNREVRPVLSAYCFKCHGPDEKTRKGHLRLDLQEEALKAGKSGEIAITPGKPDASEVMHRVLSSDSEDVMPPPSAKKEMKESEKDILKRWIASGAKYVPHWAFVVPQRKPAPDPGALHTEVRNPIDAFVAERLQKEGLKFSPPADPFTLARRVSLDLTGLPPTPEEADAFARDTSPDAYEKLVDRLLASPHYGERWARKWLDLARYADTNGYEKDRPRVIWPFRDWVIEALNTDKPFDQFTVEQIAGDMLPNATPEQVIATGFHRNTMLNEEGGIDPLEFRFNAITDRVATTAKTWLGLTVQCAQCHTHKYDPITHREYFQMMAFLNNADEPDYDIQPTDVAKRQTEILHRIATVKSRLPDRFHLDEDGFNPAAKSELVIGDGSKPEVQPDKSWLITAKGAETDTYTATLETPLESVDAVRLLVFPDRKLPNTGTGHSADGGFVLSDISVNAGPLQSADLAPEAVKIVSASSDSSRPGFDVGGAIDGNAETGWSVKDAAKPGQATFRFEKPVGYAGGTRIVVKLAQSQGRHQTLGRFQLQLAAPQKPVAELAELRKKILEKKYAAWLEAEPAVATRWKVMRPAEATSNLPQLKVLEDDSVLACGDQTKADTYTLKFQPGMQGVTALRLEVLPDENLPAHGPGRAYYEGPKGDFNLSNLKVFAGGQPVKLAAASHTFAATNMAAAAAIDDNLQTGWSTNGAQGQRQAAVFNFAQPADAKNDLVVELHFERHYSADLGRFRIALTADSRKAQARIATDDIESILLTPTAQRRPEQGEKLRMFYLMTAPELEDAQKEIVALERQLYSFPTTLALRERPPENPRPTFLHNRGEFLQPTERVTPGVFAVLNPLPKTDNPTRLDFARWLVSKDNPLTARVTVNRQWAAFFGRGLVRTADDFGFQGEQPSHPELLDWLADEFMTRGWSLKKLHKLIVMSGTYRQSSAMNPALLAKDPANVLLARGPRFRMEAEMIRDGVLKAAGLLTDKIGGPSVFPPQPSGVFDTAYGGATWTTSAGPDRYRRGLYTFSKRTAPYAMSASFDAPAGDVCIAQREVTNTPLQALSMLNDPVVVEAAQALGRLAAQQNGSLESRIEMLFRRCFTRPARPDELALLVGFFNTQRQRLTSKKLDPTSLAGDGDGDPSERAAWAALARAMFNLDEALTKG